MARLARDWPAFALIAFVLLLLTIFPRAYAGLVSDGRDYYVQARSILIDHDLDIAQNEIDMAGARGDARYYPIGTALLWTPFLVVCHLLLGIGWSGVYARDGYSDPYKWTVGLATLTYGALALAMIARVVSRYFSARVAVAATILMCAGSFLIWYLVVDAAASHGASLFAVTLFLYLWHETRSNRSARAWAAIGAAVGLMSVVRWQDSLFALILIPDVIGEYWRALRRQSSTGVAALVGRHVLACLAGVAFIVPQLWLWQRNRIDGFGLPYAYRVNWLEVDPTNVLFSANHGLFAWTPIVYLAVLGLLLFAWRQPRVGLPLIGAFIAQVYANSAILVWWGGSAFGARRFASCALIFTIGLAAFINWVRTRPTALIAAAIAAFVAVNAVLMLDIRAGRLPIGEGLTASELLAPVSDRIGNPFSAPASLLFSMKYGVPPAQYDALGRRVYTSLLIDVGGDNDDVFLTRGWWDRERNEEVSFRWAVDGVAELAVPLRERGSYDLRFHAEPFAPERWEPLSAAIYVNDAPVGSVLFHPGWGDYVVPLSPDVLRRNLNLIRFRFSRSLSPLAAGISSDPRALTARFDRIDVMRRPN